MTATVAQPNSATFPVAFDCPDDAAATYTFVPAQFPAPVSPLFQSLIRQALARGLSDAIAAFDLPIAGAKVTIQNNYVFNAFLPRSSAAGVDALAIRDRTETSLEQAMATLTERWETQWRPRLEANLDRLATMDLSAVNPKALPHLIDEAVAIARENWAIRFKTAAPARFAIRRYSKLSVDLLGEVGLDARALLAGLPSRRVEALAGLADLADAARAAGVAELILSVPAGEVIAVLESAPFGEYFLAALRDYLRDHGLRQDRFDLTAPTWQEEPAIPIAEIQAMLRGGHDPRAELRRSLRAAVKGLNDARARLQARPPEVRERFEATVETARAARRIRDDCVFFIDQQGQALTRLLFLRIGARLVDAAALERADDIFMLTLDEVKRIAASRLNEDEREAIRTLVLERAADLVRSARLAPPPFVGAAPTGMQPTGSPDIQALFWCETAGAA